MKCGSCGTNFENRSHVCPNCGNKKKEFKLLPILVLTALLCTSAFGFLLFYYVSPYDLEFNKTPKTTSIVDSSVIDAKEDEVTNKEQDKVVKTKIKAKPASDISKNVQKDVSQVIDESLKKVVTIYTDTSQGSGFLINDQGDVLTNAHVVEGSTKVTAVDSTDHKHPGAVIGYSNDTDVAIVRVAELAGETPLALEASSDVIIGDEVIALGSPSGLKNTATLGYITGVNRSFVIGERAYENIYQMSAHIAEGSSGGPLLSLNSGKAVAINSARLIDDDSVGFSIPIKDVYSLISEWIASPLDDAELYSLFYNDHGNLYYQEEAKNGGDVYFDGGHYTDDDTSYYEIPDNWYNTNESFKEEEVYREEAPVDDGYSEDEMYDSSLEEDQNVENGIIEDGGAYNEQDGVDEAPYYEDGWDTGFEGNH